ncbi:MAG TPA: heme biosynthesis HemY N-terminal domain-containing protein, partial [Pseudomonadales bacterium]|nr:heme biosynthesis HemY N-terminal domain-containing protein [Pseudomonadales bacterium]
MKRSLLTLLMVAIVAGWVGTLIARDAGYVLISYNGATLQTGLWVMLAIVVVTGLLIYSLLKFAIGLRGASGRFKNWGSERRRIKAAQLTTRGLIYLQEGEFERA